MALTATVQSPAVEFLKPTGIDRPTGHLPMRLTLHCACPDRRPAEGIGYVLGRDGVEQLRGGGLSEVEHFTEKLASNVKASRNVAGAIELRIHDEPFPTGGGTGFLKIYPHQDEHTIFQLCSQCR